MQTPELSAELSATELTAPAPGTSHRAIFQRLADLHPVTRAQLLVTGVIIALTLGLTLGLGLQIPPGDLWAPLWLCGPLTALAIFYLRRDAQGFALCLKALVILVGTSALLAPLTYDAATLNRPWTDHQLAAIDGTFGLSAGAVVVWTSAHPAFNIAMQLVYSSVFPQIILTIVVLGFAGDRRLDLFVLRFMMAGLITAATFAFFPAQGSCVQFGLPTPPHYVRVLSELHRLRDGVLAVTWRDAEGIVTFPSFHTIWAALLIAAFQGRRLFWPVAVLNGLVLVSCITTGMHYFVDVAAGLVITGVVIAATRHLCPTPNGDEPVGLQS